MKNVGKIAVMSALLSMVHAMPGMAQIENKIDFTTAFPFYAGEVRLPAGSYHVTRISGVPHDLMIQSNDTKRTVYLEVIPTQSAKIPDHGRVAFHRYGNVQYLDRITVGGKQFGMQVAGTRQQREAAAEMESQTVGGSK